jgi:signal transduction histidine kinase
MTWDQVQVVGIAIGWSGTVGLAALAVVWWARRRSLRALIIGVAAVAILAVVAGMIGTAKAMFLSYHDFDVLVLVSITAGVVSFIVAGVVSSILSRSSHTLQESAKAFGESGNFVPVTSGPAELQALSKELERTSIRLQDSRERERRSEEARRELVSWVSHDLRTPLAGIRAMTEALEDGIALDPSRYRRQIRAEVDRMVRMVDDLFELSRIHAGVLPLNPQPVSLTDLVSECLAAAEPVAEANGVLLKGAASPASTVIADHRELSRALANLVMNAIRHTPPGAEVTIVAAAETGGCALSVTDACGGIAPDELERVFDVAWRGSTARTPGRDQEVTSGAGLGLAIVKGIVEAHQGTVDVENFGPGCRFVLQLPAQAA